MWLLESMKFFKKIMLENKNSWKWKIYVFLYFIQNLKNFKH